MAAHPSQSTAPVRRPVVGREPVVRHRFAPRRRWRVPRGVRRFLVGQLALLALILLLTELEKPTGLSTSTLAGPRLASGPICIEEAVDVSGSMISYTAQREQAERELFAFADRELKSDDLMSAVFFANSATVALPPSPFRELTAPPVAPADVDPAGTRLAPAVDALVQARDTASDACALRALVVITDGQIFDVDEAAAALAGGSYARVFAVIPIETGWGRPQPLDGPLGYVAVEHFTSPGPTGRAASVMVDAKPLDVVLGDVVGSLTGQQLAQKTR